LYGKLIYEPQTDMKYNKNNIQVIFPAMISTNKKIFQS